MWWRLFRTRYARDLVLGCALALTTLGFVLFPKECVAAARTGLELLITGQIFAVELG